MNDDQARELATVVRQMGRDLQKLVKTTSAVFTKWDHERPAGQVESRTDGVQVSPPAGAQGGTATALVGC